jgi:hypothetical protein
MTQQEYVNSLSLEQLKDPKFTDASNKYVQARLATLDPIAAALSRPNKQRDRLIAANEYAQAGSPSKGERQQIVRDIVGGGSNSAFDKFLANKKKIKENNYINSLKINSLDRYNDLVARKAIDPNNPTIMKIAEGLAPTQNGVAKVQTARAVSAPQTGVYVPQDDQLPPAAPGAVYDMLSEMTNGGRGNTYVPKNDQLPPAEKGAVYNMLQGMVNTVDNNKYVPAEQEEQYAPGETLRMLSEMANGGPINSFGA